VVLSAGPKPLDWHSGIDCLGDSILKCLFPFLIEDRWQSGRMRTLGKRVYRKVTGVRIPPCPPFKYFKFLTLLTLRFRGMRTQFERNCASAHFTFSGATGIAAGRQTLPVRHLSISSFQHYSPEIQRDFRWEKLWCEATLKSVKMVVAQVVGKKGTGRRGLCRFSAGLLCARSLIQSKIRSNATYHGFSTLYWKPVWGENRIGCIGSSC
jgi:hypothetical protein